jgi:predicted nucleotidyltransferase
MNDELAALAEILAGIPAVYLFGSRVRGDHRTDSDVDVRVYTNEWDGAETLRWWQTQNETDFAELKSRLPGVLSLHREAQDDADKNRAGIKNPVLLVRRAVCVWTPRRTTGAINGDITM